MEVGFFWVAFTVAVAVWASKWGRNPIGWFALAFLISPLLAGIFLAIAGENGKACPRCAETVRKEAVVCKHCSHQFEAITGQA